MKYDQRAMSQHVETLRLEWHSHDPKVHEAHQAVIAAHRAWEESMKVREDARRAYQQAKAIYKTAREFNTFDFKQAEMLHRLKGR